MIELNFAKEVILCTGDTNAVYNISDIILEYEAIFDDPYATIIREAYFSTACSVFINFWKRA